VGIIRHLQEHKVWEVAYKLPPSCRVGTVPLCWHLRRSALYESALSKAFGTAASPLVRSSSLSVVSRLKKLLVLLEKCSCIERKSIIPVQFDRCIQGVCCMEREICFAGVQRTIAL
jgi:hypothetical protein